MKKYTICILAAATALTGIMQPVQAGEKERYLIGGLLGGWILNNVSSHSTQTRIHHSPSIEVYSRSGSCSPRQQIHQRRPSGRYEYRQVEQWVPGHHVRTVNRCGRVETRWVSGRYETRTEKVWVSYGSSHSQRYGRGRYSSR